MVRKFLAAVCILNVLVASAQPSDIKMNLFITGLMNRMMLDEMIGQLNLLRPG